jgi:hypothetical protein
MATHWTLTQRDLFEPTPPVSQLTEIEQRKALDLLQALLACVFHGIVSADSRRS